MKKISIAEIEELRQKAEEERKVRKLVQADIEIVKQGQSIPAERQMVILRRGNKGEILSLLQAYAGEGENANSLPPKMSPEVQLYIYENWQKGPNQEIYEFLLDKVPYTDEFAVRLINDEKFAPHQKLSPKVERYYLNYKLNHKKCEDRTSGASFFSKFFESVKSYFFKYDLAPENETFLIENYLNPKPLRDSYIDNCHWVVRSYISCKKRLHLAGEKALIASGNHRSIMLYIQIATSGLQAEDELLARGNREEIIAYFERYATL